MLFVSAVACSGYVLTQPSLRSPPRVSAVTLQLGPDVESQVRGNWEHINTLVAAANAREDFGGVVGGSYVAFCGVLAVAFFAAFSLSKPKKHAEVSLKPLWELSVPRFEWNPDVSLMPMWELPEFVPPVPGANIRWKAGTTLPSLDELTKQCAIIGEELGCPAQPRDGDCIPERSSAETRATHPAVPSIDPWWHVYGCTPRVGQCQKHHVLSLCRREYVLCTAPVHDQCDPDEEFSAHYGQPVYVCRM